MNDENYMETITTNTLNDCILSVHKNDTSSLLLTFLKRYKTQNNNRYKLTCACPLKISLNQLFIPVLKNYNSVSLIILISRYFLFVTTYF